VWHHDPVTTATAPANTAGIEICYETFGDDARPTIMLIMGLGGQMISWPDEFCEVLVERGYHVVRFDNRDVGRSTWLDTPDFDPGVALMELMGGGQPEVPYMLDDLAADAVSLLDHLGIESAHIVGVSMGGMIAQSIAIGWPDRTRSLTSIMSTTGEPDVGQPRPEVLGALLESAPADPEAAVQAGVEIDRIISSPDHFDEALSRAKTERAVARGVNPAGVARQMAAIVSSPPRNDGLESLSMPTLVIHGRQDPLVTFDGGERTAKLVPGAEFMAIDDMGHDIPVAHHARVTEAITTLAARADA